MPAAPATADVGGVDVSGLDFLPGLDALVRCADGTVPALVLATFLHGVQVADLDTDGQVLEVAVGWNRLTAWTQARHYQAVAEFVRRPIVYPPPDPAVAKAARRPLGRVARDFGGGDEVGPALGLTVRGGEARVGVAVALAADFPATLAALGSGRIDHPRLTAMLDEAGSCRGEQAARVEAAVLARGRRSTPGQFRAAVRRTVLRIDAPAARARAEQARADQWVKVSPADTDTAWLDAHLGAEDAMAIRLALDAAAGTLARRGGETRTKDQLRAAALAAPFWAALATGQLTGPDGPIALAVAHGHAPALDLTLEPDHDPADPDTTTIADLAGYGPITGRLGREIAARARLGSRHPMIRVHQPLTTEQARDAAATWPVEAGYRPSAALVRHITARDRTCPHPGCTHPAARADLDHTTAWPHGPTHPANLSPTCRRHHRYKQHRAVHLHQPTPGHFTWTMPTGHQYEVGPPADDH
jgi:hypothetical protein